MEKLSFSWVAVGLLGVGPGASRAQGVTLPETRITVDPTATQGPVNALAWGLNGPTKELDWVGDAQLVARWRKARIKLVRVSPIRHYRYARHGRAVCTSAAPGGCDFAPMDALLRTVFDAGAEPVFEVVGYPGPDFAALDWAAYARFMRLVVRRYNVDQVLGRRVRYWELWNEPANEPDGLIPTKEEYAAFVRAVGGAMKQEDPALKLVGPAVAWEDLGASGWVSHAARYTNDLLDVLCWHDYGDRNDPNAQHRLDQTPARYHHNLVRVRTDSAFVSPTGKTYGAAISEYNVAWRSLQDGDNAKFRSNYGAVFAASAVINAVRARAEFLTYFTTAQPGDNCLGLLEAGTWAPYAPYYAFHLLGNRTGATLVASHGSGGAVEHFASVSADGHTLFVVACNKSLQSAAPVRVEVSPGLVGGAYTRYLLDAHTLPLAGARFATAGANVLTAVLPPLSVAALEVALLEGPRRGYAPAREPARRPRRGT